MFPPQPVFGMKLSIAGLASAPPQTEGLLPLGRGPAGGWVYRVTNRDRVAFTLNGNRVERPVHRLLAPSDFELTPCAERLRRVSDATGGRHVDLLELGTLVSGLEADAAKRSSVTNYRLWSGPWPLVVILVLVCSEYLLRRTAGRAM